MFQGHGGGRPRRLAQALMQEGGQYSRLAHGLEGLVIDGPISAEMMEKSGGSFMPSSVQNVTESKGFGL